MNILVINWQDISNPLGGGAEVHLHEIFKRIAAMGHSITLLCCKYPGSKDEEVIDGIHIIRHGGRSLFNYHVYGMYRNLKRSNSFDAVIDDINKIPFYTPLYVKEPLIGIIHHLFGESIFIETSLPAACYVNVAERLIPPVYRSIPMAVVSDSTKNELIDKGFSDDKIDVIHNGVDSQGYYPQSSARSKTPLIGYLGRIKKYKSIDHLIQAFKHVIAQVPEARLLIIGDGDYLFPLKQLAAKLNLENAITFTGSAGEDEKRLYLNKVWFTVNPSPKEGWGLTVIESNACGSPVIAANSPGLRDSVSDGYSGLLYPYGVVEKLARKMIELVRNQEQRNTLQTNCISWAQQFTWDVSADKMIQLIQRTINQLH